MEHSLYDVDKEARFQKVYDAYMQDVYRLCFSYMKNKMDTEDAVQETFIRIISCLDKIDESDEHKTIAFLITVIKNISYDMKRKRNKTQEESSLEEMMELDSDPEDEENRPDVLLLRREQEETILQVIRCLPPDYRYALTLKYAHGCNTAQLAALLNCSEKLARVKLSRARKSLMTRMEQVLAKSDQ